MNNDQDRQRDQHVAETEATARHNNAVVESAKHGHHATVTRMHKEAIKTVGNKGGDTKRWSK